MAFWVTDLLSFSARTWFTRQDVVQLQRLYPCPPDNEDSYLVVIFHSKERVQYLRFLLCKCWIDFGRTANLTFLLLFRFYIKFTWISLYHHPLVNELVLNLSTLNKVLLLQSSQTLYRCYSAKHIFFTWVFFHGHSQFTGQQKKGEAISVGPLYRFHPLQKHLDISRKINVVSSPLHIASSRTRTGNFWFESASH